MHGPTAFPYRVRASWRGDVVADSARAMQLEPPGSPPVLCFPRDDVSLERVDADLVVPLPEEDWAAGYVAFDDTRALVEVIDSTEADAKRWPTWGDATDLVRMLDVVPDGDGYVSAAPRGFHCHAGITERVPIEASHVLGQAIVIGGRHAPGRRWCTPRSSASRWPTPACPCGSSSTSRPTAGPSPPSSSTSPRTVGGA